MPTVLSLRSVLVALGLLALAACSNHPPESAFLPRGGPDSLLDVSSEVVNLSIAQPSDRIELSRWMDKDKPTRAELYCAAGDLGCAATQKLLSSRGVPTMLVPSANNTVTLVYERILAHDCSPRYLDPTDYYNASHPAFGCATAANLVQEVSNKQDFVNPRLSDSPSARGPVGAYQRAFAPKNAPAGAYNAGASNVNSIGQ